MSIEALQPPTRLPEVGLRLVAAAAKREAGLTSDADVGRRLERFADQLLRAAEAHARRRRG